ncbi:hypothetical protein K435DRAFT_963784 [Dendrothele bispora CBS 962.96]|uniref:Uncharacterized protein n=1 Tax=Dendrothele bispora (strain CBS 962.96) TaxID=1314807 RepID=A0A4S8MFE1_DENBC|nr:hypothetical protein K435DRAFT_963784 [Dendrothele bispora CBS 962.96]
MDYRDQRSSLPTSLIPHLYSAPHPARDSSTRTTLLAQDESDNQQQYDLDYHHHPEQPAISPFVLRPLPPVAPPEPPQSRDYDPNYPVTYDESMLRSQSTSTLTQGPPIRSDPAYYASSARHSQSFEIPPPFPYSINSVNWREGEPGPSSQAYVADQFRRTNPSGYLPRREDTPHYYSDRHQPTVKLEHYADYSVYHQPNPHGLDTQLLQTSRFVSDFAYEQDTSSNFQLGQQDPYIPPPLGGSRRHYEEPIPEEYATGYPTLRAPTPSLFEDRGLRGGKRSRAESLRFEDQQQREQKRIKTSHEGEGRKRVTKKIAIACDFCRGERLIPTIRGREETRVD